MRNLVSRIEGINEAEGVPKLGAKEDIPAYEDRGNRRLEGRTNLYLSPHITRVRWAGHVARMVEARGSYKVLVEEPE